jgi:acetoin utilization deacetylase AcuC-like enzyme
MARIGFFHHPRFLDHDTGPSHPERPQRLTAILTRLESGGILSELDRCTPEPAPLAALEAVHESAYVKDIERAADDRPGLLNDINTFCSGASYEAARLAAGAVMQAADGVMSGQWDGAFVAARPPGHHAEASQAMGFCLFNNVAVAARHLQSRHGLARVAILDWDVHHGNGTQHSFEDDDSVFYASLHQFPHYPGTGAASERGRGVGEGTTLNRPMSAGSGDVEWMAELEERVLPALEEFAPQFLILSAGFDAHRDDPLSDTRVTVDGYRRMTEAVKDLAAHVCEGRIVSALEGGYGLDSLARSVEAHLEVLRT